MATITSSGNGTGALTLPCGVTLLAYGRPGLFLRATADPDAKNWSDRFTVVTPTGLTDEHVGRDTCAYAALLPLGDREALLAYSDFNVPGPDGTPRKTIVFLASGLADHTTSTTIDINAGSYVH